MPRAIVPSTEELVEIIQDKGYASRNELWRGESIPKSTLNDTLWQRAHELGSRDVERIDAACLEQRSLRLQNSGTDLEAPTWQPSALDPEEYEEGEVEGVDPEFVTYSHDDVRAIVRSHKNTVDTVRRYNTKLQRALYDQREKYDSMARLIDKVFEEHVQKPRPAPVQWPQDDAIRPWTGIAPIADPHLGKYVYGKEGWGNDYNTEIAADRLRSHGDQVARWVEDYRDPCEHMYLPDVGDFFHAIDGKTENGTWLHQDTRSKRVIQHGLSARLDQIESVRAVAKKITILFTEGNHDHDWLHMFYLGVQQHFRNDDDVEVVLDMRRKAHLVHGDAGFVFDHGSKMGKLNTPSNIMRARNVMDSILPAQSFERRYFICGNLHYREQVQPMPKEGEHMEEGKDVFIRLPAMAESDSYEEGLRVHSAPGAIAYRLYDDGWIRDAHEIYF